MENFFQENDFNLENIKLDQSFFNMVLPRSNKFFEGELLYAIESVLFKIIEVCRPEVLDLIEKKPIKIREAIIAKIIYKELVGLNECITTQVTWVYFQQYLRFVP